MSPFQRFIGEYQRLLALHNKSYSERQADAWWEELEPSPWSDVRDVMRGLGRTSDRFPSIATIIGQVTARQKAKMPCTECNGGGIVYVRGLDAAKSAERRGRRIRYEYERVGKTMQRVETWKGGGATRGELIDSVRHMRMSADEVARWVERIPPEGIPENMGKVAVDCICAIGETPDQPASVTETFGTPAPIVKDDEPPPFDWSRSPG